MPIRVVCVQPVELQPDAEGEERITFDYIIEQLGRYDDAFSRASAEHLALWREPAGKRKLGGH
jgi:hypothetical protein